MRDTAVIIPCYNEAQRLDIRAFSEYSDGDERVHFLFVDDGSTDQTSEVLERLHRLDADAFRILRLEQNSGKAEAVRQGVLCALEDGPAFIGYWDADLATPLEVIDDFRGLLEDRPHLEMVLGARVRLLGREVCRTPSRHYLGRAFASVASLVLGLGVYDTQCGAKLFRVSPTTRRLFDEPFCSSWIFDIEILARLVRERHLAGLTQTRHALFEWPLDRWHDVAGSKVKPWDFLRAPLELLAIHRRYLANLGRELRADPAVTAPASLTPHFRATPAAVPSAQGTNEVMK